ncbi:MAG TPA: histidine kinase [Bacteroidales bacterium]|nr:histidine kinase [Bacteroidales bacterium]
MELTIRKKAGRIPEYVIYIFLWLIFLIIPVITNNYSSGNDFIRIRYDWLRMLPFLIVFLLNSLILLPWILFRGKTRTYLFVLILVVSAISMLFQVIGPILYRNDPKLIEQRILRDPQYGRQDMMPGAPGQMPVNSGIFDTPANVTGKGEMIPGNPPSIIFLNTFLISLLIAGFNTSIAVTNKWVEEEQARKEIEKEHIRSELAFLQNQVSPHFFMNTLNNIHALIEADAALAQDAVLRLSELMRYLLYESERGDTTLRKEAVFLQSYVNLMKLRVDDRVRINLDLQSVFENVSLPPLLFISFIENSFKHGISYREASHLSFSLKGDKEKIEFTAVNTIPSVQNPAKKAGGIGLENIRKRLDLLYGKEYNLEINKTDNEFRVRLVLPALPVKSVNNKLKMEM